MPTRDKIIKKPAPKKAFKGAKANPPKMVAEILAMRVKGLKAVPKALAAVNLTDEQKHKLVEACIYGCSGERNFARTDRLDDIAPNIAHGVQVCVVGAAHKDILVDGGSTENSIVADL